MMNTIDVPAFQAMPSSVSRISTGQIVQLDTHNEVINQNPVYTSSNVKREVSYTYYIFNIYLGIIIALFNECRIFNIFPSIT